MIKISACKKRGEGLNLKNTFYKNGCETDARNGQITRCMCKMENALHFTCNGNVICSLWAGKKEEKMRKNRLSLIVIISIVALLTLMACVPSIRKDPSVRKDISYDKDMDFEKVFDCAIGAARDAGFFLV